MSLLFVSYAQDAKDFVTIQITRMVAKFLLENVTVPLAKKVADEDFLMQAEVDLMDKNYSLDRFDDAQFNEAYDLIYKNRNNPILVPYVDELLAVMQADPRFETAHA